jgi:hypothetical protein
MTEKMDELRSKAEIIAEATGRTTEAVLEDLLDDGVVNLSNEDKRDKDLVAQLKEAAELIATVQNISAEVSANTVLNGGDNSTEVKVETTLEGDIVDRALESVQRKAEKIKMIIAIVAPILLLLTGGVGLDYFMDNNDSSESPDDIYIEEIWGCTVMDAENYDPMATDDDGSCYWDDNNGGGGGPPDCEPDWWWKDESIFDHDHDGQGFNNDLRVQVTFRDLNQCNIHMNNGYFEIMVGEEDRILEYNFHDEFTINEHYLNLPAGDYYVTVSYYTYDNSMWNGPETWVTMESEPTCVTDLIHKEAELYLIGGNELEVAMIIQSNNDCESEVDFMFSLYHNDTYQSTVEYGVLPLFTVSGTGEYRITMAHSDWKNLEEGLWNLETRFYTESDGEVCCIMTNKVEVKSDSE